MRKILCLTLGVGLLMVPLESVAAKKSTKKPGSVTSQPKKAVSALGNDFQPVHSFSRMIGFDPHPAVTEYLQDEPKTLGGRPLSFAVETLETWKSEPVSFQELGFRVEVKSGGQAARTLMIPKHALKPGETRKGTLLGEQADGDLAFRFLVVEPHLEKGRLTGITYEGQMLWRESTAGRLEATVPVGVIATEPAKPVEVGGQEPVVSAATPVAVLPGVGADIPPVVAGLLEKAWSLPPDQEKVRNALLKKALLMLEGMPHPGPDVELLMQDLRTRTGTPTSGPAIVSGSATVTTAPVLSAPIPDDARGLYDQAVKAFALGQEPEARDFLRRAVEKAPQYHQAWVLMGKNALTNRKYARAQEAFQQAVQIRADDLDSAVGFFKASYYLGDSEKGLDMLKAMKERQPNSLRVREALAEAWYQSGDLESCLEECRIILERDPKNTRVQDLFARTTQRMK